MTYGSFLGQEHLIAWRLWLTMDVFWIFKSSFSVFVQILQESSKKLTNIFFHDILGFVHSMAKKSMKKCRNLEMLTKTD